MRRSELTVCRAGRGFHHEAEGNGQPASASHIPLQSASGNCWRSVSSLARGQRRHYLRHEASIKPVKTLRWSMNRLMPAMSSVGSNPTVAKRSRTSRLV